MSNVKLAIELDSLTTNIYALGSGLVLSEPTVATVDLEDKDEVKLYGEDAKKLIGKTAKNTKIVFPVFEGEIVNQSVATGLLRKYLEKLEIKPSLLGAQVVFSVPCGVTVDMIDKYKKLAKDCGLGRVYFVENPILSALGQRIPLNDSSPCFIIDMAGGVTNIGAVSLDGVIAGVSINLGANNINVDIMDYIAEAYGLQIGLLSADKLRNEIGSLAENDGLTAVVNGRDLKTGTPKSIAIKAVDIQKPIKKYYDKIFEYALSVLTKLPPEVSAEVRRAGIYLSGMASRVYGLDEYYTKKFDIKINVADNGQYSVVLGAGMAIGNSSLLKKVMLTTK